MSRLHLGGHLGHPGFMHGDGGSWREGMGNGAAGGVIGQERVPGRGIFHLLSLSWWPALSPPRPTAIPGGQQVLQLLRSHLGTSPSGPVPHPSSVVSPTGSYPNIPLRGGRAAWGHQPWPGSVPALPCQPPLPSPLPRDFSLKQLSFYFSPAKSPPRLCTLPGGTQHVF